jgi:hypothetical protein
MKLEFARKIFEKKKSNTKFRENQSSGSQAVPRGRTDGRMEIKTGMAKPLVEILRTRLKELRNPQPRKPVCGSGIEPEIFRIQRKTTTQ